MMDVKSVLASRTVWSNGVVRFGRVVENWLAIMTRTKKLTAFTASYWKASVIFPYILVAPAYFAEKIQLGGMMQTASAFGSVQSDSAPPWSTRAGRCWWSPAPGRARPGC